MVLHVNLERRSPVAREANATARQLLAGRAYQEIGEDLFGDTLDTVVTDLLGEGAPQAMVDRVGYLLAAQAYIAANLAGVRATADRQPIGLVLSGLAEVFEGDDVDFV